MVLLFNSFLTFVENLSVLERLRAHINIKEMFLQLFFRKNQRGLTKFVFTF
jgi:hypothetical protein